MLSFKIEYDITWTQGVHSPRLYTGISIRENEKKPQKYQTILLITQKYHHL